MLRRPERREAKPFRGNRDNPEEVRFGRRADTDREKSDFHILPPQLPTEFAAPLRRRREMALRLSREPNRACSPSGASSQVAASRSLSRSALVSLSYRGRRDQRLLKPLR